MLKGIRKIFNTASAEKDVEMKTDAQATPAVDPTVLLAAANEALASSSTALQELTAKFTEMSSQFDVVKTALAAAETAKAALETEAKATKLAARKAKVEAAIGTEKAPKLLAATEALDDVAFDAVVSSLAGSILTEAGTDLFKEVGASGSVDVAGAAKQTADVGASTKAALELKYGTGAK